MYVCGRNICTFKEFPFYGLHTFSLPERNCPLRTFASIKVNRCGMTEILVCQSGTCRRHGSEAVLMEIEELVGATGASDCRVEASGCLGLCRKAPNAVVVKKSGQEEDFTRLNSLDRTVEVVKSATGRAPPISDPGLQARLHGVRAVRARQEALSIYRWNSALRALQDQFSASSSNTRTLRELEEVCGKISSKAGFGEANRDFSFKYPSHMPVKIEEYSQWTLIDVSIVSRHTAVFHFVSSDLKRGTPHPRGSGRRPPSPVTWHTTILAEVGPNKEGPLPWIERDYTPISSAKDWENGKCDLLIKIYEDGAATSWMHRITKSLNHSPSIWMSKPIKTLEVPGLVVRKSDSFFPSSVLLVLGGTGVVALPQVLYHRNPQLKLGISTPLRSQLRIPIDLILSCREDDVLMLPEVVQFCKESQSGVEKGLRNCTLLLTDANSRINTFPFTTPTPSVQHIEELASMENAQVIRSRLKLEIVIESLSKMPQPCRVVVSGPAGFNTAAREMLKEANVPDANLTILES